MVSEPTTCPQCGEDDTEWERFPNASARYDTARQAPGKECQECGFAVYNYDGAWEW